MTGLTALVLGLGIRAGVHDGSGTTHVAAPVGVLSSEPSPSPSASTDGSTAPPLSPSATPRTSSAKQVNGAEATTRYGPVQVQITVRSGRITAAQAVEYPTQDRRDREINGWAIPQLQAETVQAQSAQIDTVSGATYTSDGYLSSLQSAIDQAHSAGLL
jgi:uncharacterized protein with FMN-binding domain